jgi:ribonucleoside-diphosphate reductase alpha chain
MSVEIQQRIVGCSVVHPDPPAASQPVLQPRPELLSGKTYKLKTPLSEHALYITINDLEGRPFEIFINSKAMEHFQWVVALTRLVSAVFRHGGEVNFLIEELRSVFDPKGGYFAKGHYVPSLVAAIGDVLERHLIELGLHQRDDSLQVAAKAMIEEKTTSKVSDGKLLCPKCGAPAMVVSGGCETCLECGWSRCS